MRWPSRCLAAVILVFFLTSADGQRGSRRFNPSNVNDVPEEEATTARSHRFQNRDRAKSEDVARQDFPRRDAEVLPTRSAPSRVQLRSRNEVSSRDSRPGKEVPIVSSGAVEYERLQQPETTRRTHTPRVQTLSGSSQPEESKFSRSRGDGSSRAGSTEARRPASRFPKRDSIGSTDGNTVQPITDEPTTRRSFSRPRGSPSSSSQSEPPSRLPSRGSFRKATEAPMENFSPRSQADALRTTKNIPEVRSRTGGRSFQGEREDTTESPDSRSRSRNSSRGSSNLLGRQSQRNGDNSRDTSRGRDMYSRTRPSERFPSRTRIEEVPTIHTTVLPSTPGPYVEPSTEPAVREEVTLPSPEVTSSLASPLARGVVRTSNRGRGSARASPADLKSGGLKEKETDEVSDNDNYPEVYKQLVKSGTDPKDILETLPNIDSREPLTEREQPSTHRNFRTNTMHGYSREVGAPRSSESSSKNGLRTGGLPRASPVLRPRSPLGRTDSPDTASEESTERPRFAPLGRRTGGRSLVLTTPSPEASESPETESPTTRTNRLSKYRNRFTTTEKQISEERYSNEVTDPPKEKYSRYMPIERRRDVPSRFPSRLTSRFRPGLKPNPDDTEEVTHSEIRSRQPETSNDRPSKIYNLDENLELKSLTRPEILSYNTKPSYIPRDRLRDKEKFRARTDSQTEDPTEVTPIRPRYHLYERQNDGTRKKFVTPALEVTTQPQEKYKSKNKLFGTAKERPSYAPPRKVYTRPTTTQLPLLRYKERPIGSSETFERPRPGLESKSKLYNPLDDEEEERDSDDPLRHGFNSLSIDSLVSESEITTHTTERQTLAGKPTTKKPRKKYSESHVYRIPLKRRPGTAEVSTATTPFYFPTTEFLASLAQLTAETTTQGSEITSPSDEGDDWETGESEDITQTEEFSTEEVTVPTTTSTSTTTTTTTTTTPKPKPKPPSKPKPKPKAKPRNTPRTTPKPKPTTTATTTTSTTTLSTSTTTDPPEMEEITTLPSTTTTTSTTMKPTTTKRVTQKPTTKRVTPKPTQKAKPKTTPTPKTTSKPKTTAQPTTEKPKTVSTTTVTTTVPTTTSTEESTTIATTTTTTSTPLTTTSTTTTKPSTRKPSQKPKPKTTRKAKAKPTTKTTTTPTPSTSTPKILTNPPVVVTYPSVTSETPSSPDPTTTSSTTPTVPSTSSTTPSAPTSSLSPTSPTTPPTPSTTPIETPRVVTILSTIAQLASNLTSQTTTPLYGNTARFLSTPQETTTTAPPQNTNNFVVYGLLPNNDLVRKVVKTTPAPLDVPFIIYGLYPNGTIVRRYPNGTVVPDEQQVENEVIANIDPGNKQVLEEVVKKDSPLAYLYPPSSTTITEPPPPTASKTTHIQKINSPSTTPLASTVSSTEQIVEITTRAPTTKAMPVPTTKTSTTAKTTTKKPPPKALAKATKATTQRPKASTAKMAASKKPTPQTTVASKATSATMIMNVTTQTTTETAMTNGTTTIGTTTTTARATTKAPTTTPKSKPKAQGTSKGTARPKAKKKSSPRPSMKTTTTMKPTSTVGSTTQSISMASANATANSTTTALPSSTPSTSTTTTTTTTTTVQPPSTTKSTTSRPKSNKPKTSKPKGTRKPKPKSTTPKPAISSLSDVELLNNVLKNEKVLGDQAPAPESEESLANKVIQLAIQKATSTVPTPSSSTTPVNTTTENVMVVTPESEAPGNKTGKISLWVIEDDNTTTIPGKSSTIDVDNPDLAVINTLLSTPGIDQLSIREQLILADVLSSTAFPTTEKRKKKKPKTTTTTTTTTQRPAAFPLLRALFGRSRWAQGRGLFGAGDNLAGGYNTFREQNQNFGNLGAESYPTASSSPAPAAFGDDGDDVNFTQAAGEVSPETQRGLVGAAINVSRAVSQFMGFVIQGATQSFQNYLQTRTSALANALSTGPIS